MSGFYGVALYHPVTEANVGTVWRSAMTYKASFIGTVGRRYKRQSSDTCKTPLSLPLHHYGDLDDLIGHLPWGCRLIGVEMDPRAVELTVFRHPRSALYLLGAEDHGLPLHVLDQCHEVVQIPTPSPWSLNVATAGTLLLHDRYLKAAAVRNHSAVVA